jgi:cation diffusion facilitator CzcD-associated flavoprotein CzcO/acetyl esterase/lipase
VTRTDAVVVGAGLAGLYALYKLRGLGLRTVCFEAGSGVGGTWYWNRYPGARCDVESVDYSYSFSEELQQDWTWTERYASQPEILAYIEHVAERFDLLGPITFDTRVVAATFDEAAEEWEVTTDAGARVVAPICVMATGCLSTLRVPDYPGIDSFGGELIHPGAWPHEEVRLDGRRVAVIGTGSTGIQLVSALAPEVDQLHVFQRTANYSMPAHNGPMPAAAMDRVKAEYPERRREARRTRRGFPVPPEASTESIFDYPPEEREQRLERMWANGGAIFTAAFGDLTTNAAANEIAAEFVRDRIREKVADPEVAARLCPEDHPLGGKRPCVDTGYYETFNRENVRLIDINETPIVEFDATGLRTTEGHVDLDAVIIATGYDAITGTLNAIDIRGRDGRLLREKWADGPTALLGLMSAGFPGLFLLTGPGSPSVLCNMTVSIEQHTDLMITLLERARQDGSYFVEAEDEAEQRWAEHVAEIAAPTVLVEANSWYLGANIPGKPRRFMPYAAGMVKFIEECDAVIGADFEGFRFGLDDVPIPADVEELLVTLNGTFPALGTEVTDAAEARTLFEALRRPPADPTAVSTVWDEEIPGPDGDPLPLRHYEPTADPATEKAAAVLFIHGGGWVLGGLDSHDELARKLSVGSGATLVAVDYRLAPEHRYPAALEDCLAALAHVSDGGRRRVVVVGDSAGANLALVTAMIARDRGQTLAGQVLLYPMLDGRADSPSYRENGSGFYITADHLRWFWRQYLRDPAERGDPHVSPLRGDLRALGPTFVLTPELDPLRDDGVALVEELAAIGASVTHERPAGAFHGFLAFDRRIEVARGALERVCVALATLCGTRP